MPADHEGEASARGYGGIAKYGVGHDQATWNHHERVWTVTSYEKAGLTGRYCFQHIGISTKAGPAGRVA